MIRNRIVDHVVAKGRDLQDHTGNWRTHPAMQAEALASVLEQIGIVDELLVYESEAQGGLTIIDGHLRANSHPDTEWPCTLLDVSDAEADLILATFDPLAALAGTAPKALEALLERVGEQDGALGEMLDAAREAAGLLVGAPVADPGAQVDKAAELQEKWQVERGQVWSIGRHRLMCGDSTCAQDVARLIGEEKAQAVITDPPFAVRDDRWDQFSVDSFAAFMCAWLEIGKRHADVVVSFMADKNVPLLRVAAAQVKLPYRRALIWRKPPGSQFAGASLDGFWFDFEIIQVFGRPKFKPDKQTKMAVLEHRTVIGQQHGCEKPVELLSDLVIGYSQLDNIVVDLFAGSGTTLVACEQTGRIGYGMEICEKYVSVTLERLSQMGLEPRLLERE